MSHSTKISETDRRVAVSLRDEMYRVDDQIKTLAERKTIVRAIWTALALCDHCSGSGTVNEGRTSDDMPNYQPCGVCGGYGHNRKRD